jgi:hypothetical protein
MNSNHIILGATITLAFFCNMGFQMCADKMNRIEDKLDILLLD